MSTDATLRLRAFERVQRAVATLAQLGPASQILDACAAAAAAAADLDRLVVSRIEAGALVVERVHLRASPEREAGLLEELRRTPLRLAYPLVEGELLRRRQARLVAGVDPMQPARYAFAGVMAWEAYLAVPVSVDGLVVGFLHGDRADGGRPLAALDADALEQFAFGFAMVFERAVLRRRLRDQRREIRRIAAWAEARSSELSDGVIALGADDAVAEERRPASPPVLAEDGGLGADLTAREVDVLRLMAEGMTNADIARALFVSQGTVKFHVKNILRKMQAANRSDASARYLRLTLRDGAGAGAGTGAAAGATPTLR